MTQYKLPTKDDLRELPKNKAIESIVLSVEIKTWRELITDPATLEKFKEEDRDTPQVVIKYESEGWSREEKFFYQENPTTTSKLGRYIVRYDTPVAGQKIQVDWDAESKPTILLAK